MGISAQNRLNKKREYLYKVDFEAKIDSQIPFFTITLQKIWITILKHVYKSLFSLLQCVHTRK